MKGGSQIFLGSIAFESIIVTTLHAHKRASFATYVFFGFSVEELGWESHRGTQHVIAIDEKVVAV